MRITLTHEQVLRLRSIARNAKDVRELRRAQALLDLCAGDPPEVVARRYQVSRSTVYNWINRWRARGLNHNALRDLPRRGRPRRAR